MRLSHAIVCVVLVQGCVACGGSRSSPTPVAPSPVPQPAPIQLVTFTDPTSKVTTQDVRDVDDQIMRFNSSGELIWVADGSRFSGYPIVQGSYIKADFSYQVRFGTRDGERRAYFAGHDQDVIYDVEVVNGQLLITFTNHPVPGT